MRSRYILMAWLLPTLALGQLVSTSLKVELAELSSKTGLALAGATGSQIALIPFDGRDQLCEFSQPNSLAVFGSSGLVTLWWRPRDFWDDKGDYSLISIDGKVRQTGRPTISAFSPLAFNEGTRRIAFLASATDRTGRHRALYWAKLDFSVAVRIADDSATADWSPSGNLLVYSNGTNIYIADIKSGKSSFLVRGHNPTWCPSEDLIAFVNAEGGGGLIRSSGEEILSPLNHRRPIGALRWSPDGRFISFSESLPSIYALLDRGSRLFVLRREDGETTAVQTFGSFAINAGSFQWILDYRKFAETYKCRAL